MIIVGFVVDFIGFISLGGNIFINSIYASRWHRTDVSYSSHMTFYCGISFIADLNRPYILYHVHKKIGIMR